MRRGTLGSWVLVLTILAFLFVPIAIVVLFSFNAGTSTAPPFEGFSLRWYREIFSRPEYTGALRNSAIAAAVTATLAVVIGTIASYALSRLAPRVAAAFAALFSLPLLVPGLFIAVALLSFFSRAKIEMSLATVIVGHLLITLPLVVGVMSARLSRLDVSMLEAARDLGAGGIETFFRVLLPLLAPVIVGVTLLALAWSADEFIISLYVNGGDQTVPVVIFGSLRTGLDPKVNALASTILATTVATTVIAGRLMSLKDLAR